MTISLRLSKEEAELIKEYAKVKNMSVSELVRTAVIEKIEDEIDLAAYKNAILSFEKNPKTYTLEEIEKELEL